jgi:uncharacterized protein YhaN
VRIAELTLTAFGPFSGTVLDFSTPKRAVHLVYGPNEAGKSTALRAITGLLFGIPVGSRDDHLHRKADLRVGARLESAETSLSVVRRKGQKGTLLDPSGAPIDETPLRRMLGGMSEELFRVMFGLDHDALRRGAQALLEGKGHMGETLFGAALGGGLHEVLARLRDQADGLFTPTAHKRPVNEALRAFADAQRRSRQPLTESSWVMQQRTLEEAIERQTKLEGERRDLRARHAHLRRARLLLPLLAERSTLLERRRALGDVVALPESATAERQHATRDVASAVERSAQIERAMNELEHARSVLAVPEALVRLDEDTALDLQGRLGTFRKASRELPRLRADLASLEQTTATLRGRLGDKADHGVLPARIDAAGEARIKKLALERARLEASAAHTSTAVAELEERVLGLRRRAADLAPARSPEALEAALAHAQKGGDLAARRRELEAEASRLEAAAQARLRAMGLFTGDLTAAVSLPVPPDEAIERASAEWARLAQETERVLAERERAQSELADRQREIDEVRRAGAPPTEDDVARARCRRDEAWQYIRDRLCDTATANADADAHPSDAVTLRTVQGFEQSLREADLVADRLWREADRAVRLARLTADHDAIAGRATELAERARELSLHASSALEAWRSSWKAAGIDPLPPAEMRAWRGRHVALVALADELARAKRDLAVIESTIAAHRAEIEAALASLDDEDPRGAVPRLQPAVASDQPSHEIGALLARATHRLAVHMELARERRDIERSLAAADEELVAARRRANEHTAALERWTEAWGESIAILGLSPAASVEEADAVLDALGELWRRADERESARRRLAEMERDIEVFTADVTRLALAHAKDLAGEPTDAAAAQLVKRYQQAQASLAERAQIDRQLSKERRALTDQFERKSAAEMRLRELMERAAVTDMASLERAEGASGEARALDQRIAELEQQLVQAGGASLTALEVETRDVAQTDVTAELEELEDRTVSVDDALRKTNREIGSIEKGFEDLERRSVAAEAAAEAQEHLARARSHIERYLRVRLGALLLEREIERYRSENQGPVLSRASAIVRRLSLGSIAELRVGYADDEEPSLRCARPDGRELDVEALSDGARDQLYLALRLATLERYAQVAEPMPLIVDDIFIQFDDDRTRAGLEVLGELAETTQVLVFTHHSRLLDLAREAIPPSRWREHRLTPPSFRGAAEALGER